MRRGQLYTQCINYKPCRTEYLKDLKAISAKVTSMKLTAKISAAIKVINPVADVQFGTTMQQLTNLHTEQAQTLRWIVSRQAQVATLLKQNGIK
jgi:predicted RNA-binding protein